MENKEFRETADVPSEQAPSSSGVTSDEIFRMLNQLTKRVNDIPPGLIDEISEPQAGGSVEETDRAIITAKEAGKRLTDEAFDAIRAYVDSHVEDLVARSAMEPQFAIDTFEQMHSKLDIVRDSMMESLFETFGDTAERIRKIPVLSAEQKKERIRAAYSRAEEENRQVCTTFNAMVDKVAEQFRKVVEEIEQV